jgi:hypothetical protein
MKVSEMVPKSNNYLKQNLELYDKIHLFLFHVYDVYCDNIINLMYR